MAQTRDRFLQTGTGAVARTIDSKLRDTLSVFDFMTEAEIADVQDRLAAVYVHVAIQAAIDAAVARGAYSTVFFPTGQYLIGATINLKVKVNLIGEGGSSGVYILTDTALGKMVELPQSVADTNLVEGIHIENIDFSGADLATHCIQGYGNHLTVRDCRFRRSATAATEITEGWDNTYDNCYWFDNLGYGMYLPSQNNNQVTFNSCMFVQNTIGAFIASFLGVKLLNCLFEANTVTGLYAWGGTGLSVDTCYFEGNGGTGMVFTTPSVTVNANIILNGYNGIGTMSAANPVRGCTINNCFADMDTAGGCMVYAISTEGLTLDNSSLISAQSEMLVDSYGSTTSSSQYCRNADMRIRASRGWSKLLNFENSTTSFSGSSGTSTSPFIFEDVEDVNIAEDDLNMWTQLIAGSGGVWTRSTAIHDSGKNIPVWEMVWAATSTSHKYGFGITGTDYPDLVGKPCMFEVSVKAASTNTPTITLETNGGSNTSSSTDWKRLSLFFTMPSGALNSRVSKTGATGIAYFANPILCEIGADSSKLQRRISLNNASFNGTSAPTVGTWAAGDKIYDTTPSAGGTMGWVCTTGGVAGGTAVFKTFGAISA